MTFLSPPFTKSENASKNDSSIDSTIKQSATLTNTKSVTLATADAKFPPEMEINRRRSPPSPFPAPFPVFAPSSPSYETSLPPGCFNQAPSAHFDQASPPLAYFNTIWPEPSLFGRPSLEHSSVGRQLASLFEPRFSNWQQPSEAASFHRPPKLLTLQDPKTKEFLPINPL